MKTPLPLPLQPHLLRFIFLLFFSLSVSATTRRNPFTPKSHLIRYWNNKIHNLPYPAFLLAKASPLSAADSASFAKLADQNAFSTHLDSFCNKANLLCFPDPTPDLAKHSDDVHFDTYNDYSNQNFTNYGTGRGGGFDSFKTYSKHQNLPVNTFRRYSGGSTAHSDRFISYAHEGNVPTQAFNAYGSGATGGHGKFKSYAEAVNVPHLEFTSYSADGNGRKQSFAEYEDDGNGGDQAFASYGKDGERLTNSFSFYANNSILATSDFSSYSQSGKSGGDNFTSYGDFENQPVDNFRNYADGGHGIAETFASYRGYSFQSYAKESDSAEMKFSNYRRPFIEGFEGSDKFSGYGEGSKGQTVDFKSYDVNNTFKDYVKDGVTFSEYSNATTAAQSLVSGKTVNKWIEPGKFFREEKLKAGTVIPMPDIKDKIPNRSFLPRSVLSKLPFSTSKIPQMKQIFHAWENSSMEIMLNAALRECERAPAPGETKRCVGSAEDMIDFAVSVLGDSVELRTTENTRGSKSDVMIGRARGINGGKVTQAVSCHQSLYPYLLYYCHSVPKVRVYEADILDPKTKGRINHGVAICHLDTSSWSGTHGAFLALGSGPGKIEVCHWIFENDLTWAAAD